jgi:hypothetical protein
MSKIRHLLHSQLIDGGCKRYVPAAFISGKISLYSYKLSEPRAILRLEDLGKQKTIHWRYPEWNLRPSSFYLYKIVFITASTMLISRNVVTVSELC